MRRCLKVSFTLLLFLFLCFNEAAAGEVLSWVDCIREAAKNNPDLISAEEEVKQSQAGKKITASSLFPQIDSNLRASSAKAATAGASDTYTYGVTGSQLIFDGAKTMNNINAASENINAAKQSFRFTSAAVRYRLRVAFVSLLRAQEMLRITQEIYDIRRDNLQLITLRYASGLEHKGALLTAQADLADAEYGILKAQRDLEVAQRDLVKEMGRGQLTSLAVNGDFTVQDSAKVKPDFEVLAKNNPSLLQLVAQKNAAEYGVKSAYANFSPTLTGQAGANKSGSHWSPTGDQWNLGLTLSMPIFEGGLRFAQVSQAKALLNQLREDARSRKDSVILILEQAWAMLQDTMDNVGVQEKMLIANEVRSEIGQAQYSLGIMTFDNWIIIEDNLVGSKKAHLNSRADALLAEAYWIQAKGETLEYD
ncbi:MAG: TolC family protein [Candidatus Omnitrophota bacterium]